MTDAVAVLARIVDEFGADQGAEVVELARAFMSAPPTPPSARRRRVIPILRSRPVLRLVRITTLSPQGSCMRPPKLS